MCTWWQQAERQTNLGSLSMRNVCFVYEDLGNSKRKRLAFEDIPEEKLVLKHLDLEVADGEFVCLVGHSGCGKSTALRILAGLQNPIHGEIFIDGKPLRGCGLDRAVVFQNYSLFPWMTAKKNIEFGIKQASDGLGRGLGKEQVSKIADEYLERVNIRKAAELYPYQLSGGMQQRIAIARALAMDAETLLFDEPFGALDVKTRRELQMLMEGLWMDSSTTKTALFVTHDVDEALLLADRIIFMSGGKFLNEFRVSGTRPRDPEAYSKTEECQRIRGELLDLFYNAEETKLDQTDRERVYEGGASL